MFRRRRISKVAFIIVLLVWLIIMYFATDLRPIAMLTGAWTTSTSSRYGFSINHPQKWTAHQYGEEGYKGIDDVVFIIRSKIEPGFGGVWIRRRPANNPSLEEVASWGKTHWQTVARNSLQETGLGFREIELMKKDINGVPVLTRRYALGETLINEDVYIARTHDMIIITLYTTDDTFDRYKDEFDRVVRSFSPMK